ncbi:Uncharacterized protein OS=Planctomyces brasiliensis (strain ATCC 49424 / DSM 5305 / JCM 21570 / NBRC 103401 / IFAM 1448) GN=Plabr_0693 PE=4 SV=1 [Gemmata massiliana]|uniref:DUF7919 domain-containing protein n=1 Tax=Gemmata massiliana TaxID=1210884 RepID=A0A6P2CPH2_9BACT|nr:Uncharacterized protein OS=Planctomyces brasiliensis (strain ATCC 49424 / DSM 5305 / JCM 21570 / NBRC 103401 / IFAM 1448) GN=Plabr_0693 PE=4 SV=1 [Gemmata massiliana]
MYYPDLSNECQVDRGTHIRAIGWLSADHLFTTGSASLEFLNVLMSHVSTAWAPVWVAGPHFCEFCPKPKRGEGRIGGSANVWIPTVSAVYVAPALVTHYIESHSYLPPEEFIAAVLACPPQSSPEFHELMGRHSRA